MRMCFDKRARPFSKVPSSVWVKNLSVLAMSRPDGTETALLTKRSWNSCKLRTLAATFAPEPRLGLVFAQRYEQKYRIWLTRCCPGRHVIVAVLAERWRRVVGRLPIALHTVHCLEINDAPRLSLSLSFACAEGNARMRLIFAVVAAPVTAQPLRRG